MMKGLYTLLYTLGMGFIFPYEYLKRPSLIRKKWFKDKIGAFEKPTRFYHEKTIWIHCVSVGEVMALSRLIYLLSERFNVLLSTITDTGQLVAQDKFKDLPLHTIYVPFDIPSFVKRTIQHFCPEVLLIAETEIWPNLIKTASQKLPVILVNGRLSEKSFKRYLKVKFFIKDVLNDLAFVMVQDEIYKERFELLGVKKDKILVTGNTKFDIEIPKIEFEWEGDLRNPIIIAGSTHDPEEKEITKYFLELPIEATLLIAPRHPQRFERVAQEIKNMIGSFSEIRFLRLSQVSQRIEKTYKKLIVLVDKIGVLASLYRICDIAIIGGSFIPHGGQNPLEAIYWKKPVIFGPYMNNFPFVKNFIENEAVIQTEIKDLGKILKYLLVENTDRLNHLAERAYIIFLKHRGATQRILKKVLELIE